MVPNSWGFADEALTSALQRGGEDAIGIENPTASPAQGHKKSASAEVNKFSKPDALIGLSDIGASVAHGSKTSAEKGFEAWVSSAL